MLVKGPRLVVFGMDGESPQARDLRRRERATKRAFQQTGFGDSKASQDHQGNRMPGNTLAQPVGRIVIGCIAEDPCVEANDLLARVREVGLRGVRTLAL